MYGSALLSLFAERDLVRGWGGVTGAGTGAGVTSLDAVLRRSFGCDVVLGCCGVASLDAVFTFLFLLLSLFDFKTFGTFSWDR